MVDTTVVSKQILNKIRNDGVISNFIKALRIYNTKSPKCLLIAGKYLVETIFSRKSRNVVDLYVTSSYSSNALEYIQRSMGSVVPTISYHDGGRRGKTEAINRLLTYSYKKGLFVINVTVIKDDTIPIFDISCENIYFDGFDVIIEDMRGYLNMVTVLKPDSHRTLKDYTSLEFVVNVDQYKVYDNTFNEEAWCNVFGDTNMMGSNWESVTVKYIIKYMLSNNTHKMIQYTKHNIDDMINSDDYKKGWGKNIVIMDGVVIPSIKTDNLYAISCDGFTIKSITNIVENEDYFTNLCLDAITNCIFKKEFGMPLFIIHMFGKYIKKDLLSPIKNLFCHTFCTHHNIGCNIPAEDMFDIIIADLSVCGKNTMNFIKPSARWEFAYSVDCVAKEDEVKHSHYDGKFLTSK